MSDKPSTEYRDDPRSADELIRLALAAEDEDKRWKIVTILHSRATREVFEAARNLCSSENSEERRLGADILGQLGVPDRAFPAEAVQTLLDLASTEADPDVLSSAITALGHNIDHPGAWQAVVPFKDHPSAEVRHAVAFALSGVEEPDAVQALIELSEDEDEDVRNWATFGLGSQCSDVDTPEVREALVRRLTDPGGEVRAEALIGLAYRKDVRMIEPLIKELADQLSREDLWDQTIEAAREMPDPRMCPYLIALRSWDLPGYTREDLEAAINACQCTEQDQ